MTDMVEIRGMNLFPGHNAKLGYDILALADIYVPALELHCTGIELTWSERGGYFANAPRLGPKSYGLKWKRTGEFSQELIRKLIHFYEALGGKLPEAANDNDDSGVRRVLGDKS